MNKLNVAFLWHMHQPMYKDLLSGKYYLPWVRLHSTYSYLDMASILDKFPEANVTFNFSPSLLWQLMDLSSDKPVDDIYLNLTEKSASELEIDEKYFILKNFFSCDYSRGIAPVKKFKELYVKRGDDFREEVLVAKVEDFSASDFRDLQVLFNLAWCGFTLRGKDPLVKALVDKGSKYTEEEKNLLLAKQKEVIGDN